MPNQNICGVLSLFSLYFSLCVCLFVRLYLRDCAKFYASIASLRVLRSYPSFPLFDRRINNARTRVLKQQALNNGLASMDDFLLGQAWDEKYGSYIDGALKGQVPPDNLKWHPDLLPANM